MIAPPPSIIQVRFKREEVLPNAQSPRADEFKRRVDGFCRWVAAWRENYKYSHISDEEKLKVGILLPPENSSGTGYGRQHIQLIEDEIQKSASPRDVEILRWPPVLGSAFAAKLSAFDWIVVDIGGASAASGIVGYLHGRFIPMLRLMKVPAGIPVDMSTPLIDTLFGGYEVGYPKDIVRWNDEETLQTEVEKRIKILDVQQEPVATLLDAQQYFRRAALRNEAIFVSYSGADADIAEGLITVLGQRFKQVFDYRDGKSIPAGKSWMSEIFTQIEARRIGVLLYSASYFKSDNCLHEARVMLARLDSREMKLVPVKLRDETLEMPAEFSSIQYLRRWTYSDWGTLVDAIIHAIDG